MVYICGVAIIIGLILPLLILKNLAKKFKKACL